jgi:hypothetical protein
MSGGNPGAMVACTQLLEHGKAIDPRAFSPLANILDLDTLHIYDDRIYMFWNDVCGRDVGKMIAVLRANQLGQLAGVNAQTINYAIDHRGQGLNLKNVVEAVKERLPEFNPEARETMGDRINRKPTHPLYGSFQNDRSFQDDGENDQKKRDKWESVKV